MARILILYATREGHTGRIAARMAQKLRQRGHAVEAVRALPSGADPDFAAHDGVIVGASIHYGRHPGFLGAMVRRCRETLSARPAAFFSVSLSAGGPGAKPEAARRYLEKFLRRTGWRPLHTAAIAGALQYSKYGAFKRALMIAFVGLAGGDTDTSRDYEYTDWDAVDRFCETFGNEFATPAAADGANPQRART